MKISFLVLLSILVNACQADVVPQAIPVGKQVATKKPSVDIAESESSCSPGVKPEDCYPDSMNAVFIGQDNGTTLVTMGNVSISAIRLANSGCSVTDGSGSALDLKAAKYIPQGALVSDRCFDPK